MPARLISTRRGLSAGVSYIPVPLVWEPSGLGFEARLARILAAWRDTPYLAGQQLRGNGGGVDCVRFVCAVWDELSHRPKQPTERLPRDASLHSPATARAAMRGFMRRYQPIHRVVGGRAQSGDVLVTGIRDGGPGHVILVGPKHNTLWQAGQRAVDQYGWALVDGYQELMHHYRFGDRSSWPIP